MLAPGKKSYDQPRQHIKRQRNYFANKGPSSHSYGFSQDLCNSYAHWFEKDYLKYMSIKVYEIVVP